MPWYMWSMMGTPVVTAFGTACYDLIDVCHVISRCCGLFREACGYTTSACSYFFVGMFVGTVCMLMFRVVSIRHGIRLVAALKPFILEDGTHG